jgi:YVTN family beta-propeller protein
MFARLAVFFLAVVLGSTLFQSRLAQAGDTPKNVLLVLAKGDQMLAIVDPATLQVIEHIPVGNDPHEIIASADGATAYVSNYGFGAYNTLTRVDLTAQKALPPIDLGPLRGPHGLAFAGEKVWFTAERAKAIGSYDPATNKVDWILGTGQNRTHMIYVASDLHRIITTNVSSGTVSIIDRTAANVHPGPPTPIPPGPGPGPMSGSAGDWNETVVRVGNGSEGFDVTPDGKQIWVANAEPGTVSIVDAASKTVTQTLAADVAGANRLKFTPDGSKALISTLRGSDLTIIDTATHQTIKRIPVGHGAAGIVMQPDGSRAFVACSPDGYVTVIDLHSLEVASRIQIGKDPDGMAWVTRP